MVIAETITAVISADGTLGPWAFDAPPPVPALFTHAVITGGQLFGQNGEGFVSVPFTDHITGPWTASLFAKPPQPGIRAWILDEHGVTSGRSVGQGANNEAWTSAFDDAGTGAWLLAPAHLSVARGDVTLVRAASFVYALGGDAPPPTILDPIVENQTAVEVAPFKADGTVGDFVPTAVLPTPTNTPVVVGTADHVYVLGGMTTTKATSLTDAVFAAKIKDGAGALDAWAILPKLPQPMHTFAAIATPSFLFVFGGYDGSGKSLDAVLRLEIHADGTFGSSWSNAGTLPGARSNLTAVTF